MTVEERLEKIESLIVVLVERQQVREWYTTEQFARLVGKAEFTCREWCRLGRITATKKASGRGKHSAWAIGHEEWLRYQRGGLRPGRSSASQLVREGSACEQSFQEYETCSSNRSQPTPPSTH
jgi:hypothetical protein